MQSLQLYLSFVPFDVDPESDREHAEKYPHVNREYNIITNKWKNLKQRAKTKANSSRFVGCSSCSIFRISVICSGSICNSSVFLAQVLAGVLSLDLSTGSGSKQTVQKIRNLYPKKALVHPVTCVLNIQDLIMHLFWDTFWNPTGNQLGTTAGINERLKVWIKVIPSTSAGEFDKFWSSCTKLSEKLNI